MIWNLMDTMQQAAFDPRVKAAFCWFATDIHSATLGKGKSDDSLIRVKKGDLKGTEVVVCHFIIRTAIRMSLNTAARWSLENR